MMRFILIVLLILIPAWICCQVDSGSGFRWGNALYVNLKEKEIITYNQREIELISVKKQFNTIRINKDTMVLKVSRRSLPVNVSDTRIFVADNRCLKELSDNQGTHGLLAKDALICLSDPGLPLLDPMKFKFPVDFTDGFQWSMEEESHMFSFYNEVDEKGRKKSYSHEGIDLDMNDARILEKHLIVAPESGQVVWIEENKPDQGKNEACLLLRSELQPDIFYLFENLSNKKLFTKQGQKLVKGQELGYVWGDNSWGNLHLAIIRSDTVPSYDRRFDNLINYFPQLYELYTGNLGPFHKQYSKGSLTFGRAESISGNIKNTLAMEEYNGKGWQLKDWNPADRVESVSKGIQGNARLQETLFLGTKFECTNPDKFYDFDINVIAGVYRVRAEVGDVAENSWQKIEFEGVAAGTIELTAGAYKWTTERAVKVQDGRLTVRIYYSPGKIAGISALVFQRAY